MIMQNGQKKRDQKNLAGGLGGSPPSPLIPESAKPVEHPAIHVDERTPGKDLRLINSAVSRGWMIRPAAMSALPDAMLRIALDGQAEVRARVNAARVIVSMHGQNEPQPQNTVNVAVGVSVQNTVESLLSDPNYAAYLESSAGTDSSAVCANGHGGKVPEAGPHPGNLHGHN